MCVCVFVCDPAIMREKEGRGRARRIIRVTGFTIPTTGSDGGHLSVGSVTQVVTLRGCSGADFYFYLAALNSNSHASMFLMTSALLFLTI